MLTPGAIGIRRHPAPPGCSSRSCVACRCSPTGVLLPGPTAFDARRCGLLSPVNASSQPPAGLLPDVKGLTCRARSLALATLLFVLFLTFLDNTIVTVVLANVQSDLHASVSQLQWVVNGYALTFASLMLSFGTIGDLLGRKKVILFGVAVFCAGSVIAAVAPTTDVLIAGRVVMGIGAAASEPGTLSMIRHLYPDRAQRARSLGIWAAVSSLGLALGPLIGGLLVFGWSWRAIFWANVVLRGAGLRQRRHRPARELGPGPGPVRRARADPRRPDPRVAHLRRHLGRDRRLPDVVDRPALPHLSARGHRLRRWPSSGPKIRCSTSATSRNPPSPGPTVIAFTAYFGTFAIFFMVALYLQVVVSSVALGPGPQLRPAGRRHGGGLDLHRSVGGGTGTPTCPWPPGACWPGSGSCSPTPMSPPMPASARSGGPCSWPGSGWAWPWCR